MATASLSTFSDENTNYTRLCKLLFDGGTRVLRDVFDSIHPPHSLRRNLADPTNHAVLRNLLSRRILFKEQWNKLYPTGGSTVGSQSFDLTLLCQLLRSICNLPTPTGGWNNEPAPTNISVQDDIVRIKLYRKKLHGQLVEPAVSDADFNRYWSDIAAVLVRLGGQQQDIAELRVAPMDPPSNSQDTDEVYEMKSNPRGLMVIINFEKFQKDGLADRRGSEKDVESLNRLFYEYLDFKVKIMLNKARYEVLKQLREISENEDHRRYDCLAVCIMSHGDENQCFYATDGDKITVQEVVSMFTNTQCAVFRRKPKLFFIQACRGKKGRGYALDHVSDSIGVDAQVVRQRDSDMSDILIAYSSYEGYAAFRDETDGTFFIQCLVRVFRQYSYREHLVEMLTRVNKEVHDLADDDVAGRTQVPEPTSTLRKKLYFFPKSL